MCYNLIEFSLKGENYKKDLIYLDTYTLQRDMRIRLPKSVITNMNIEKGKTKLGIFFDKEDGVLVLKTKMPKEDDIGNS